VVAGMKAEQWQRHPTNPQRRGLMQATLSGVLFALVRSQSAAAATTALYRNQQIDSKDICTKEAGMTDIEHDGAHDFDFYFGRWQVRNERLKERLVGNHDWEAFEAECACHPILGGKGNWDEYVTDAPALGGTHFIGNTLRLFNPATREWSLYWMDNRRGVLEPPVVGRFERGVGTFLGRDEHKGRPVLQRFVWSGVSANVAHWEQALSTDEGRTWETNWRMTHTRIA
jgi:hypothetical protein